MCASANECHHPHPTPPHPIPCDVCAGDSGVEKMMQNCACVYLWLQSVCAGDSGKWLCAHVTPVCVRGWLWVEKMMQNCACVYLWLQSVSECVRGWPPDLYHILNIWDAHKIQSRPAYQGTGSSSCEEETGKKGCRTNLSELQCGIEAGILLEWMLPQYQKRL